MNPEDLIKGVFADVIGRPGFDPGPVERVRPDMTSDLIQTMLLSSVPPLIARLSGADRSALLRSWTGEGSATNIGTFGDQFLYGGKHSGSVFENLAKGLAALSTAPGGVTAFGLFFCASHFPQGRATAEYVVCVECS